MPGFLIETPRLRLRPYRPADTGALHRLWTNPAVRRYLLDDELVSLAWAEEEVARSAESFADHGYGSFVFVPRGEDEEKIIGFGGFRHFFEPPELQLLYGLHPDYWGRGLATEAARALVRFGFETCGFDRIVAAADVPNTASFGVMERCGLAFVQRVQREGQALLYYTLAREAFAPDEAYYRLTPAP